MMLATLATAHQPNSVGVVASENGQTAGVSLGLHNGIVVSVQHAETDDGAESGYKVGVARSILDLEYVNLDVGAAYDSSQSDADRRLSVGVGASRSFGNWTVGAMRSFVPDKNSKPSWTFGLSRRF